MGITGRYDFKGIQAAMGFVFNTLIAATSWGAWLLASPFKPVVDIARDMLVNYLANRGLILLNLGAIAIDGTVDQAKLDAAINDGLMKIQKGRDKITPEEGKAIDDAVIKAFDNDADLGAANPRVPNVPSASIRTGHN